MRARNRRAISRGFGPLGAVFGGGTSLDTFAVEQLLELPAADALPAARLPCEAYPSDHLALLAVLHLGKR